jgi:hypothetical protein
MRWLALAGFIAGGLLVSIFAGGAEGLQIMDMLIMHLTACPSLSPHGASNKPRLPPQRVLDAERDVSPYKQPDGVR